MRKRKLCESCVTHALTLITPKLQFPLLEYKVVGRSTPAHHWYVRGVKGLAGVRMTTYVTLTVPQREQRPETPPRNPRYDDLMQYLNNPRRWY